jgi:hypothetical protein
MIHENKLLQLIQTIDFISDVVSLTLLSTVDNVCDYDNGRCNFGECKEYRCPANISTECDVPCNSIRVIVIGLSVILFAQLLSFLNIVMKDDDWKSHLPIINIFNHTEDVAKYKFRHIVLEDFPSVVLMFVYLTFNKSDNFQLVNLLIGMISIYYSFYHREIKRHKLKDGSRNGDPMHVIYTPRILLGILFDMRFVFTTIVSFKIMARPRDGYNDTNQNRSIALAFILLAMLVIIIILSSFELMPIFHFNKLATQTINRQPIDHRYITKVLEGLIYLLCFLLVLYRSETWKYYLLEPIIMSIIPY